VARVRAVSRLVTSSPDWCLLPGLVNDSLSPVAWAEVLRHEPAHVVIIATTWLTSDEPSNRTVAAYGS
jgi:hypothetical protein